MARGKLKFDWSVYSARRKVTIRMLFEKGIAQDYTGYVAYCDSMSVNPMNEADFSLEISGLVAEMMPAALSKRELALSQPDDVSSPPRPPDETTIVDPSFVKSVDNVLTATVWLAGVSDDPAETTETPTRKTHRKKQKATPTSSEE